MARAICEVYGHFLLTSGIVVALGVAEAHGEPPPIVDSQSASATSATRDGAPITQGDGSMVKHESFDRDPGWLGINNRTANAQAPVKIRQDFGYSPKTAHAGGRSPGEIGGLVTPAAEPAFYGRTLNLSTLDQPLSASGRLAIGKGGTHLLLGFFNSQTLNEWRTPNTIAIRLNARGDKFFAYVEYCTARWRAGGDSTPFPSKVDQPSGRRSLIGFPIGESLNWTLAYDPIGNEGGGVVTATIGSDTAICNLDAGHKADGASFDRFGILNVMKSADNSSEVWFDDIAVNGGPPDGFDRDPQWDSRDNRRTSETRIVRPWFDFGWSDTNFAGGKTKGELGGLIFRGDCRYSARMACYADRLERLTLDRPLKASGRIAMTRGVTDSTTLFGFFNSEESMRQNESQNDGVPECVLGVHIEGPSRDGFRFYPVARMKDRKSAIGRLTDFPTIYPNRMGHDWSLKYDPAGADGKGRITVTLDRESGSFELRDGDKSSATTFDRFGIVTSWIDGNSQNVYLDDLTYTFRQNR